MDPPRKYRIQAAEHSLQSVKLEQVAAVEEAKQEMRKTDRILEIDKRNYLALSRDYASQKALIATAVEKIKAGQSSGMDSTRTISSATDSRKIVSKSSPDASEFTPA